MSIVAGYLMFGVDLGLDYTLRNVILGSAVLGLVGGVLGCFAVLRRQSLVGDALAHAALPGVCLAFMLTGAKGTFGLMVGAAISGWIGTLALLAIVRGSRIKEDAALGVVLSVFFGVGILLLTRIQRTGDAAQSGLDRFLFGQAATLVERDVQLMAVLSAVVLAIVWLLFKEFKLLSFDPDFAAAVGFAPTPLTVLLTTLIVVAVVIGLQTVGVVLMVALLIAPASAARQWTNRLGRMLALAGLFGALSGVVGAVLSARISRLPTGPTIVLAATAIVAVSVLFAPERGVLWAGIRQWRHRRRLQVAALLRDLADRAGATGRVDAPALAAGGDLRALRRRGWVGAGPDSAWVLTPTGETEVRRARRQEAVWKRYLGRQMNLPPEAIHHGVMEMERVLPDDTLRLLEAELAREEAAEAIPRRPGTVVVDPGTEAAR